MYEGARHEVYNETNRDEVIGDLVGWIETHVLTKETAHERRRTAIPLHGEYKVPGGKLVVVDLAVEDGRIAAFRLAGDFFLEPDEALEAIDRAVTGLPVESSAADDRAARCAARCRTAPCCSASRPSRSRPRCGVRSAARRTGGDFEWELLHPAAVRPAVHLALDQVLLDEVGAGPRRPTLRIWEWDEPAVVIGKLPVACASDWKLPITTAGSSHSRSAASASAARADLVEQDLVEREVHGGADRRRRAAAPTRSRPIRRAADARAGPWSRRPRA